LHHALSSHSLAISDDSMASTAPLYKSMRQKAPELAEQLNPQKPEVWLERPRQQIAPSQPVAQHPKNALFAIVRSQFMFTR
jgi:hypothetical protein